MRHTRFLLTLYFLLLVGAVSGEVRSSSGNILFHSNTTGTADMMLSSAGLGIGVTPSTNLVVAGNALISSSLYVGGVPSAAMAQGLYINGSIGYSQLTLTGNGSMDNATLIFADSSSGNIHVDLPEAAYVPGRVCMIKKTSPSNTVWVSGAGPIDGYTNLSLTQASSGLPYLSLMSGGNCWNILSMDGMGNTISSTNLVLWLPLETSSGNVVTDYSGMNQVCSMANGLNAVDFTTGAMGKGIDFDGVNDLVIIDRSASLDMSEEITVSLWYYHGGYQGGNNWVSLCGRGIFSTDIFSMGYKDTSGSETIGHAITISTNSRQAASSTPGSTSLNDSKFHHLAVTFDRRYIRNFCDGIQIGTYDFGGGTFSLRTDATKKVWLGNREGSSTQLTAGSKVDDFRIYNRALSSAEISQLYQAGK